MWGSKNLIEAGGELRVSVMKEVAKSRCLVFKSPAELACLLGNPGRSRMLCAAREVDAACAQFNEEEHVDRFEPQGFDGEEIAGDELILVMVEKSALRKSAVSPLWGRRNAMPLEEITDSRAIDGVAEFDQFAFNMVVAPTTVLAGELKY